MGGVVADVDSSTEDRFETCMLFLDIRCSAYRLQGVRTNNISGQIVQDYIPSASYDCAILFSDREHLRMRGFLF